MIFQAIGAKYSFGAAIRHAFSRGSGADSDKLRQALKKRYNGEVVLYRKGRSALAAAIRQATGGEGKVAISGLTCYSMVQAVEAAGCTPVFVDIRDEDLQFGAAELEAAAVLHSGIKAVVLQNMLGIPADIAAIQPLAGQQGWIIIEDLAHAAGTQYPDGREVGTVGDITMLSFGRDKAIDVVNGGALIVRSQTATVESPSRMPRQIDQLRDRLYPLIAWLTRTLHFLKIGPYYIVMAASIKLRLVVQSANEAVDETMQLPHWQAKLALNQVNNLTTTAVRRRQKSKTYASELQQFMPSGVNKTGVAPIRVPLLVGNQAEVVKHLSLHKVQAGDIWYDVPISPRRLFGRVDYPANECPNAVRIAQQLLNLPTHERITDVNIQHISQLINEVARP